MGYIREIRKKIGHDPLMCVAAGIIIFDAEGRILLQRRSDNHLWGNPGGAMELGEEIEATLKREVLEETGLTILHPKFFQIYSGEQEHMIYPNQDEVYYVNVIYTTNEFEGNLKINDGESLALQFFYLDEIPNEITNTLRGILQDLRKRN